MSDPRFARLKTDPRFRKPRRKSHKIVVDDRFKSIFDEEGQKLKGKAKTVDKYGRKLSSTHNSDNLKRFYRLEKEEEHPHESAVPDYARGEVLMDSSDEEDDEVQESDEEDGEVVLGRDIHKPIKVPADEPEIDLDESQFAELDALAEVNAAETNNSHPSGTPASGERTNRLAVVNLDWDHVRASHLFKIFSSVVSSSPFAPREREKSFTKFSKGKVLKVQVYPSVFGKARLEQERKEGPPTELFKISGRRDDDDDDPRFVGEDDGNEYDEDALRKYQLERLRYYYAIVTCDSVEAASHICTELDGTELERSANVFDLSFVPNDMVFDDDEVRDEATQELSENYKGVEFVTDALRHSKVKLTWDDDDPERNKITRRTLSRKEIEESDFKAYLASSGSSDEGFDVDTSAPVKRDKIRSLLLGGGDEDNELLPEGWGERVDKSSEMEITFTPGLSGERDDAGAEEETTLQQYLRKQKERRKQRKTTKVEVNDEKAAAQDDEFFGEDSEDEGQKLTAGNKKGKLRAKKSSASNVKHIESTPAELELLLTSVEPSQEPKHFDMRSVVRAEKLGSKKRAKMNKKGKNARVDEDEAQEHFAINVKDERFKAIHEDHAFAIDPTNPHFKKTKSMSALLEERAKRQRNGPKAEEHSGGQQRSGEPESGSLESLVERVKRKSAVAEENGRKRRKL